MSSIPFPQLLMRAVLALLMAVNGIAPALAATAMHSGGAVDMPASMHAMPMASDASGCHDDDSQPAAPAADYDGCCNQGGDCTLSGCVCACLAVAAALPMPAVDAPAFVPSACPERVTARAHAPPPRSAVIRPPIA